MIEQSNSTDAPPWHKAWISVVLKPGHRALGEV